jgi:hypothetical protein
MKDEDLVAEAMASLSNKVVDGEELDGGSTNKRDARAVEATEATISTTVTAETNEGSSRKKKYKKRVKDPVHKFPVQPRIIQVLHKPKSYVNQ